MAKTPKPKTTQASTKATTKPKRKPKRSAKSQEPEQRRWRPFPRPIGISVAKIARPLVGKRGFTEIDIISRWVDIVGEDMAEYTLPEKLTKPRSPKASLEGSKSGLQGGVLHIRAASSAFATVLKHQETELCSRVNAHFGYTVASKIKITLGKIPKRRVKPKPPPPPPLPTDVSELVGTVDDPELQAALVRLGQEIAAKK